MKITKLVLLAAVLAGFQSLAFADGSSTGTSPYIEKRVSTVVVGMSAEAPYKNCPGLESDVTFITTTKEFMPMSARGYSHDPVCSKFDLEPSADIRNIPNQNSLSQRDLSFADFTKLSSAAAKASKDHPLLVTFLVQIERVNGYISPKVGLDLKWITPDEANQFQASPDVEKSRSITEEEAKDMCKYTDDTRAKISENWDACMQGFDWARTSDFESAKVTCIKTYYQDPLDSTFGLSSGDRVTACERGVGISGSTKAVVNSPAVLQGHASTKKSASPANSEASVSIPDATQQTAK